MCYAGTKRAQGGLRRKQTGRQSPSQEHGERMRESIMHAVHVIHLYMRVRAHLHNIFTFDAWMRRFK